MSMANSPKTEKNGNRDFIDIAKEYKQIPMRHRRCKEDGLRILKEKEINISRTTGEGQRLRLTYCCNAMAKNGLEDAVASEMNQTVASRENQHHHEVLSRNASWVRWKHQVCGRL